MYQADILKILEHVRKLHLTNVNGVATGLITDPVSLPWDDLEDDPDASVDPHLLHRQELEIGAKLSNMCHVNLLSSHLLGNLRGLHMTFYTPNRALFPYTVAYQNKVCRLNPVVIDEYLEGFNAGPVVHLKHLRKVVLTGTASGSVSSFGRDEGMHLREVT
jgi:hypothetical protein